MIIFKLHEPTIKLLNGLKGVELGAAAHNPFGVDALNVAPEFDAVNYAGIQREMCGQAAKIDMYGHAASIPVDDASQDFVLSSHVIEHAPNVIAAFVEWQRVIRPGGYVVMIVPLPNAMECDKRELSEHADIFKAFNEGWAWETAKIEPVGGHYWKFDCESMKALIDKLKRGSKKRPSLKWELVGEENPDSKVGNGFWLAYRVNG